MPTELILFTFKEIWDNGKPPPTPKNWFQRLFCSDDVTECPKCGSKNIRTRQMMSTVSMHWFTACADCKTVSASSIGSMD